LARAVVPAGRVTGLDISRPLLDHAGRKAAQQTCASGIVFVQGDMHHLPFADNAFDWAWSVDCAGYPAGELLPVLRDLVRIVRPGGVVALLGWTSQQLLPGHAPLEARLNAQCSAYAPFLEGQAPPVHFPRALHAFGQAGLTPASCTTFVGQLQAPLRPEDRYGLSSLFDMLWGGAIDQASSADAEAYARLCLPASPEFIGDLPEYCGFFTYTMFLGRVGSAR
jgi:demethylmenaquinone methyltransferase/2-methoxy-6-polyprenyl-1,4-benzoquinol methylase